MRPLTLAILAVAAAAESIGPSFCDPTPAWPRSFAEEFEGSSINASRWSVYTHNSGGQCGFGVGRYGRCGVENTYLDGTGNLVIKTEKLPVEHCSAEGCFNYSSGGLISRGKQTWSVAAPSAGYRVCVRAVLPGGSAAHGAGIWPAHWLMPEAVADSPQKGAMCDPDGGEIDILEMINGNGQACGTYHWQTTWPSKNCTYPVGHKSVHDCLPMPEDWSTIYHEYAVEHTQDYMAFVVDGKTTVNTSTTDQHGAEFSDLPFFLILNTAVGGTGTWASAPNADTAFPTYHKIDYVRSNRRSPSNSQAKEAIH
jgi:beta-glucanase (GH16 family)